MQMRTNSDLTKILNQSGFPLQMAIEKLIASQKEQHGWRTLYKEHGWKSLDGQTGFIDLVLEDRWRTSILVVECKRVLDSDWVFLGDQGTSINSNRTRLWITNTAGHGKEQFGYFDATTLPDSSESMYCVVAGQDSKTRPMLERVAAEVAASTEALALEEYPILIQRQYGIRMYASVIVTTARLILSKFDTSQVQLDTGETVEAGHEEVRWIRFRKHFSSENVIDTGDQIWDLSALASAKEKVVFVVNIRSLHDFLRMWHVNASSLRPLM